MKGSFLDFFLEADSADSGVFLLLLEDVVEELQVDSSCVDFKKNSRIVGNILVHDVINFKNPV